MTPDRATYEIRIGDHLDPHWSDWFAGAALALESVAPPITRITCALVDQSALHGVLARIRDLNLRLLSVHRVDGA